MARGTQREHAVRDWLRERDWVVVRAAGSLGCADLVALKRGERPRLIEVKSTAQGPYERFSRRERADLIWHARMADADAWLAWWPPRGRLHWIPESDWPKAKGGADVVASD